MERINWNRVILGGLVAGVVINVPELVLHGLILGGKWKALMGDLGRTLDTSAAASLLIIALNLLDGIVAVWLYAALRPRYGPGVRTAIAAGFAVWLVGWLVPTLAAIPLNIFPFWVFFVVPGAGLLELCLGTALGARLYRES